MDDAELIAKMEATFGGPESAAKQLRVNRVSWYRWRRGARSLKAYIRRSIEVHLELNKAEAENEQLRQKIQDAGLS